MRSERAWVVGGSPRSGRDKGVDVGQDQSSATESSSILGSGLCDKPKTTEKFLLSVLSFYILLIKVRSLCLYSSMLTVLPGLQISRILLSSAGTEACIPSPHNPPQQNPLRQTGYDPHTPFPEWATGARMGTCGTRGPILSQPRAFNFWFI